MGGAAGVENVCTICWYDYEVKREFQKKDAFEMAEDYLFVHRTETHQQHAILQIINQRTPQRDERSRHSRHEVSWCASQRRLCQWAIVLLLASRPQSTEKLLYVYRTYSSNKQQTTRPVHTLQNYSNSVSCEFHELRVDIHLCKLSTTQAARF